MTFQEALEKIKEKGYMLCTNPDHGFGSEITTGQGVTGIAKIVICPVVQFYPKPSYLYLTEEDFIAEAELQL